MLLKQSTFWSTQSGRLRQAKTSLPIVGSASGGRAACLASLGETSLGAGLQVAAAEPTSFIHDQRAWAQDHQAQTIMMLIQEALRR